jgi:hypothetical protein
MSKTQSSSKYRLASTGLIAVALSGVVLTLPGCGGGGSEGAPLNQTPGPAAPAPISVNPNAVTVYNNLPISLLISGGVGPYRAFSSDSAVLPVLQDVVGSTVTLSPNNVPADATVTITITDSIGGSTNVTATVKPSTINIDNLVVDPAVTSPGIECKPAVCSGGFATASLLLKNSAGIPVPNRQVRFDALQGQFNFVLNDTGSQIAKSITVTTDATGRAIVRLLADVGAATSFALIRATDLANGSRIDKSFPIAQFTVGDRAISVSPTTWKITGGFKGQCSAGAEAGFYVFGGTPPYRVVSSAPDAIQVGSLFSGPVFGGVTTVATNGGYFVGRTTGQCIVNSNSIIFITDATGRTVGAGFENSEGSATLPTAPPPAALAVTPSAVILRAAIPVLVPAPPATPPAPPTTVLYCSADFAQGFTLQGGSGPYKVSITQSLQGYSFINTVTANGVTLAELAQSKGVYSLSQAGSLNIRWSSTAGPFPVGIIGTVDIVDANSNKVTSSITCAP